MACHVTPTSSGAWDQEDADVLCYGEGREWYQKEEGDEANLMCNSTVEELDEMAGGEEEMQRRRSGSSGDGAPAMFRRWKCAHGWNTGRRSSWCRRCSWSINVDDAIDGSAARAQWRKIPKFDNVRRVGKLGLWGME